MPYISKQARQQIDPFLDTLLEFTFTEGDLNYIFTRLLIKFTDDNAVSYSTINAAVGILECCKLEYYRRTAVPYEDEKMCQNGGVYPNA